MITMIVEDVAVVAVIVLFVWLVPMRRNGIPGLRGRGRAPVSPMAARATPEPRPVPAAEQLGAVNDAGRPVERDDRVVAQLSQFRGASYAGPGPGQSRGHKHSA
jgi:hypothetical protein